MNDTGSIPHLLVQGTMSCCFSGDVNSRATSSHQPPPKSNPADNKAASPEEFGVWTGMRSSQVSPNARRRAQGKGGGGKDKNIYMFVVRSLFAAN